LKSITLQNWRKSLPLAIHAQNHALAVRLYDVQENQPVCWRFDVMVLMLIYYCLLVSCGLLLAFPSPLGSAPGGLSFSSWSGTTPPCLLIQLPGFNPWSIGLCSGVVVLCWRTVVFFWWCGAGRMVAASSGRALLLQLLARLAAVVLPAANSVRWLSCLCAACLCVSHSFGLIHSWDVVCWFGSVPRWIVPKKINRTNAMLDQNTTLWCKWQNNLPKSESNTNTNLYSYFFCLFIYFAD
jgi:hypothetical protein